MRHLIALGERQLRLYRGVNYRLATFRLMARWKLTPRVNSRLPLALSATIAMLLVACAWRSSLGDEIYWPGWLGPARNGWVDDFEPPTMWPERLKKDWQVEVGIGYSSPLVSTGRIFQHARQGDNEVLWCVDLDKGDVKWRQHYAAPFKMGGGGEWHGKGPKSTPVFADDRLFVMSISGLISAWNATSGERLWRQDYGSRFASSHPYWGTATSPIVDDDRIIVHFGNDDEGVLVALDVESGKEIWSQGKDGPSYSSPLVVEIDGSRQIVEWNHRAVVGVDSQSGGLLWEYPFPHEGSNQNMPTPTFHKGCVFVGGENRGLRSVKPQRVNGSWTAKELWHQKDVALDMSSAVVNDNLLFGFSHYDKGRLFCLDTSTGSIRWQSPGRTGDNVMFLSIPGYIIALIDNGELRIVKASGDRYDKVASYRVAETPTWAPPVLLKDGFLIKDEQSLTRWSFD